MIAYILYNPNVRWKKQGVTKYYSYQDVHKKSQTYVVWFILQNMKKRIKLEVQEREKDKESLSCI